jgi:DNA-3-methyladenine glycosylase II
MTIEVRTPGDFNFAHSLDYLRRSEKEILHRVEGDYVSKALVVEDKPVVLRVGAGADHLRAEILKGTISDRGKKEVTEYIRDWFDLGTDIKPFYKMAAKDELLKPLAKKYKGYRIVGQPDLFESLVWAVLGQQINLGFAYTLKERFVSTFGQRHDWEGMPHYIFPEPGVVSEIRPEQLLALQFSRQKAAYTIGIAKAFHQKEISKAALAGLPLEQAKERLMKIHGVGNWTANYALMKTFRYPDAFPLEDAGLHNAIKQQLNLKSKPDVARVKRIFKKYKGWEAYATLYLWKSLGGE